MPLKKRKSSFRVQPVVIPDTFIGAYSKDSATFEGLITAVADPKKVKPGAYVSGKNWLTGQYKDHIELRGGTKLMGTGLSGSGKVTGAGVGIRADGEQIKFHSAGRKVFYYDKDTEAHVEVGTNLLPAAADGEDVSFVFYHGLAGAFMFVSSPNSSIYKIPLANPGSAVDLQSTTYRGRIAISSNRMFLWMRKTLATGFQDKTAPYLSKIDKALLSDFTSVTGEAVAGSGATRSGTLATKAGQAKATCFNVVFTDAGTGEILKDDGSGNLVGTAGGTGTINYATMAYAVTFAGAAAAVTVDYQWEDSTSGGIADFSYTTPVRVTGEGTYFRQDDGGELMTILNFNLLYYCLHKLKSWVVDLTSNDVNASNLPWRDRLGLPYHRAAFANGDGITLLDYTDENDPKVRRLEYNLANQVVPKDLSDALDFSSYEFDYAVMFEFSGYDILCCQKKTLGAADAYNSVMFIRNKSSGVWDQLEYPVSVLVAYDGALCAGDFVSSNFFELFSGSDDEGYVIDNFITFGQWNLGMKGLKKTNYFEIDGYIAPGQVLEVWLAYDNAEAVKVGEIQGGGSYVDINLGTVIGGGKIGSDVVGSSGAANAFHFSRRFKISTPEYENVAPTFKCTDIGACSINYFGYVDNRYKGRHKLPAYDN